ncbi:MAG: hypothetical protein ACJAZ9_001658 [Neolewinella sp.]|jgi:hypothetical protein
MCLFCSGASARTVFAPGGAQPQDDQSSTLLIDLTLHLYFVFAQHKRQLRWPRPILKNKKAQMCIYIWAFRLITNAYRLTFYQ